ncbi:MAG: UDP-2,3-diacylglucosamine diphosphatase LpxI [Elusimicrobia bacterium]|nr:UDP-2,3-diacylglucosamine diphosphatase LpxI [Elusimicrobiota bacterium]
MLAGSGRFPLLFAAEARRMDVPVVALGIKDVTDPALEGLAGKVQYFPLGQLSKPIAALKAAGVRRAVMVGKVQHVSLFGGVMPDLRAIKVMASLKDKRTDTILRAVADEFAKDGIELLSSATFLSHLLVPEGPLTRRRPSPAELADMRLGWAAAKAVAGFDIGQTVVVGQGAVVAVEAMEGTDAAMLRARDLARSHGQEAVLTVVKVAKPRQDLRFDIPVLGLDTLQVCAEAGVRALAVEARATIIFDKDEFLRQADGQGLAILGVPAGGLEPT